MKTTTIFLCISIVILSCKKEDDDAALGQSAHLLNCMLEKLEIYDADSSLKTTNLYYYSGTRLDSTKSTINDYTLKAEYINDNERIMRVFLNGGALSNYFRETLNNHGQVIKSVGHSGPTKVSIVETEFIYPEYNGRLIPLKAKEITTHYSNQIFDTVYYYYTGARLDSMVSESTTYKAVYISNTERHLIEYRSGKPVGGNFIIQLIDENYTVLQESNYVNNSYDGSKKYTYKCD